MSDDNKKKGKKILSQDQSFINTLITSELALCVDKTLAENLKEKMGGGNCDITHSPPPIPLEAPFILEVA